MFLVAFAAYPQQYEEGVLRVKIKENYVNRIDQKRLGYGQFGLRDVDRISEGIGASSIRRIFREAGKFETAHKKYGLHLWYEIRFDKKRTSLSNALKGYGNLPQFDVVEGLRSYHAIEPLDEKISSSSTQSLPGPTNDPLFSTQWHYKNTGQSGGTPGADISLPQAWSIQTGDPEVVVAVIDGGIDLTHPDLTASMWVNTDEIPGNSIDDDANGYVDDVNGYGFGDDTGTIYPHFHGTHVAGTIAAVTNNGIGVSGIAGGSGTGNGVKLMSCAGFGASSTGGFEDAMVYAADNGAVISQNSWGGGSHAIEAAIDYFVARAGYDNSDANFDDNIQIGPVAGGIVIFAAGNSNTDNTSIGYPASYPPVMAVASTDHDDVKSYFSNFGNWVDISAPGSQVYSTYPVSMGSYAYLSGTSMACPHVSGAAALIISQFGGPSFHTSQVWDRLQFASDDIDPSNPGFEDLLGDGRVNAFQALQVADDIPPGAITDLTQEESKLSSIILNWTAPGASGNEGVASFYDIRYSTTLINEANFESADQVANPSRPLIAGTAEQYEITGLNHSTPYYFAIKAKDFFGNVSDISNVISATTLLPPVIGVSPESLDENLFSGSIVTRNLTVSNTGSSDLYIDVSASTVSVSSMRMQARGTLRMKENQPAVMGQIKSAAKKDYPSLIQKSFTGEPISSNQKMSLASTAHPSSTGRLFSLNHSTGKIIEVNPATGSVIHEFPAPETLSGGPDGLAFDGTYLYYINGFGTNDIHRIDAETGELISSLDLTTLPSIDALAHSGEFIYATDYSSGVIFEINYDEAELVRTIDPPVAIAGGISFGGQRGTLFVSNFGSAIYEINLETGAVENTITPAGTVYGLGYSDGLGILFAANVSTGEADAIDPETGTVLYSLSGILAAAMASDESGNQWLIPDGTITTITPGSSEVIPVLLDAGGLAGGTYNGEVRITSNDPATPLVEVPVTLHVTGAANISLSSSSIEFPDTFVGDSTEIVVVVRNTGTDILHVTSVSVNGPTFSLSDSSAFDLAPGESSNLTISFSPDIIDEFSDTLKIVSNDPDMPTLLAVITGASAEPPFMIVSPDSISTDVLSGSSTLRYITIQNTGASDLNWELTFTASPDQSTASHENFVQHVTNQNILNNNSTSLPSEVTGGPYPLAPGDFTARVPSPVALTCLTTDPSTGIIYGQANRGHTFYKYDPAANNWGQLANSPIHSGNNGGAVCLNGKVYTVYTGNGSSIGVYTIATNTWTTISNGLLVGTGNITTDGIFVYVVSGIDFRRYNPATNQWTTLVNAPFPFERWGGLSYQDQTIYGHQGNGYSGFAKYNIIANTWTVLTNVPGGAVLGSAIDPSANKYYAYGSYDGTNWYAYDLTANSWSVATIPLFRVGDGGLVFVGRSGVSGIYFVQGENGTGLGRFETVPTANWLQIHELAGQVSSGENEEIEIGLVAVDLPGGIYTGSVTIHTNDPLHAETVVPVTMSVTGVPDIQTDISAIAFGDVYLHSKRDSTITIANNGTDVLNITSIVTDNEKFTLSFSAMDLDPGENHAVTVSFVPEVAGVVTGNLKISSNDPDQPLKIIALNGKGVKPPITVSPASLDVVMNTDAFQRRELTITNTSTAALNWDISITGEGIGSIEEVSDQLASDYTTISGLIPTRYNFSEGESGNYISDGGGDMYDVGNFLSTNIGGDFNYLAYTNGVVSASSYLGSSGKYFTAKYPGLFVFGADINISSFKIDGNLGADGGGTVDATVLTTLHNGKTYKGFVKRVYNAGDPSVNHLIIMENNGTASHTYSSNSDSDLHKIENMTGVSRMYYLLFASGSGGYVNNTSMQSIMQSFLNVVNNIPSWFSVSHTTGTLNPGNSEYVEVYFSSLHLTPGTYKAQIATGINDPATAPFEVPVKLTVGSAPDIEPFPSSWNFGPVSVGSFQEEVVNIKNLGTSLLEISSITSTSSDFIISADVRNIESYFTNFDSLNITVRFAPSSNGPKTGQLKIVSNDPEQNVLYIALSGVGISPPLAMVTPETVSHSIYQGQRKVVNLKLKNTGGDVMHWNVTGLPSWAFVDSGSGSLNLLEEKIIKLTLDAAGKTANTYSFDLNINYNHPLSPVTRIPVTMVVVSNHSPVTIKPIASRVLELNTEPVNINLAEYFSDPDNDVLTYSITALNSSFITAAINGSVVTIGPAAVGTSTITVKAIDIAGESAFLSFNAIVIPVSNKAPVIVRGIEDQNIELGTPALLIKLAENFSDPENGLLRFGLLSTEQSVIRTRVLGSVLEITSLKVGDALLTTWAEDMDSARAEITFKVNVTPIMGIDAVDGANGLQCYPNPFEGKTQITYYLKQAGQVEINVIDVTGTVRHTLVNEYQTPGMKEFIFDGGGITSGLYFYRLTLAGKQMAVSKMIKK